MFSPLDLAERSRAHSADGKNVWATLRVCRRVVKRVVYSCYASLLSGEQEVRDGR
jgi:hypothetical protein